jgi:hypothetical protein
MNDMALTSRLLVDRAGGLEHADLDDLNRLLRRTLHNRDGYHQPLDLVAGRPALRDSHVQKRQTRAQHGRQRHALAWVWAGSGVVVRRALAALKPQP